METQSRLANSHPLAVPLRGRVGGSYLVSSSYKGTYWIQTHPHDLILINSLKTFSLNRVTHPKVLGVRALTSEFWRGHKIVYASGYCQN